jgi:hypothetical protein
MLMVTNPFTPLQTILPTTVTVPVPFPVTVCSPGCACVTLIVAAGLVVMTTLSVQDAVQKAAQGLFLLMSKMLKLGLVAEALKFIVTVVDVVRFAQLWSKARPVPLVGL